MTLMKTRTNDWHQCWYEQQERCGHQVNDMEKKLKLNIKALVSTLMRYLSTELNIIRYYLPLDWQYSFAWTI